MVLVGACCHLLVVVVCACGVMFMGVRGGLLKVVVDRSWVGAWALLVACDHSGVGVLLLWAASVVVVVGAVTGGMGVLVGDVALLCLGPGSLLLWVTRMVVVGGIVAAGGTSFGW